MSSKIALTVYKYNIGGLTVNIEFMWRALETGERTSFSESFHPFRAEPHKFYIITVNTSILYLSCNKICKQLLFNLIIKSNNGIPLVSQ